MGGDDGDFISPRSIANIPQSRTASPLHPGAYNHDDGDFGSGSDCSVRFHGHYVGDKTTFSRLSPQIPPFL